MAKFFNLCKFNTATTGTGTLTVGTAVSGFLTPVSAGAVDGDIVSYAIRDGANSEMGFGLYDSAGPTLTRAVHTSTNSNAAISLSGSAVVMLTPLAEDLKGGGLLSPPTAASMTQFGNTASNSATLSDANLALKAISRTRNDFPDARIGIGQPIASTTFNLKFRARIHMEQFTEFSAFGVVAYSSATDHYAQMLIQTNHFADDIPPSRTFLFGYRGTAFSSDTTGTDSQTELNDVHSGIAEGRSWMGDPPEWWSVRGDGTNIILSFSPDDGDNWIDVFSTTFATAFSGGNPDYVGFLLWPFGHLRSAAAPHQVTAFIKYWELT